MIVAVETRLLSYRGTLLTAVVAMLLILAGATLFAAEQQQKEAQAQGGSPIAAYGSSQVAQTNVLDGDINNDGNQDGIFDPLAALLLAPVVLAALSAGVGLVAIVNARLLVALCEPQKLSTAEWVWVLERPG